MAGEKRGAQGHRLAPQLITTSRDLAWARCPPPSCLRAPRLHCIPSIGPSRRRAEHRCGTRRLRRLGQRPVKRPEWASAFRVPRGSPPGGNSIPRSSRLRVGRDCSDPNTGPCCRPTAGKCGTRPLQWPGSLSPLTGVGVPSELLLPSPNCPSPLRPRQRTAPPASNPQLWSFPSAMAWTPVRPSTAVGVSWSVVVPSCP